MDSGGISSGRSGMRTAASSMAKIEGVTGVILAGGVSRRMGKNKALLKLNGIPLVEKVYLALGALFDDIVLVTNTPDEYSFLPCRTTPDIYPGAGSIAGLHAGMAASNTERIFVAACDMPFLNADLVRMLCNYDTEAEAVVPLNGEGFFEPLHAVYAVTALDTARDIIENGDKSILILLNRIRTILISYQEVRSIAGAEESFRNINTPEEFTAAQLRT
ncbi:MAG: molybdenum cofactor guanylyltransferase [Desulfuromonadales bacterium]|nr:molybdenum cofactor guanylyltransferase [Desulfuromonadales bacterium]